MNVPEDITEFVTYVDVVNPLTLESLACVAGMPVELVQLFVEHGLIVPMAPSASTQVWFAASCVTRLRTIRRLRRDLGINLPGLAAVLHLLDQVQTLQRQLDAARSEPPKAV